MENKSNSLNRIKRHQREKVLRFSIRKYSFGAASVAVAALMFLGARVASADTVSGSSSQSTAGVVQPNDKGDSPVGIKEPTENKSEVVNKSLENKETAIVENSSNTVDKSQLRKVVEELNALLSTKLNLDDSVLSSVKERVKKAQVLLDKADAVQKDINELKELLSTDLATLSTTVKESSDVKESSEVRESNTGTEAEKPVSESSSEVRASEESQTVSAKKDALKVSVDQLQAAILEVPEHDTTKEVLEKANELLGLAQGVLQNTTVSLTDVEQMNKLVKRMFTSVKNATTRLSSGARDPRNGQRMAQGTGFRADSGRVEGALNNVKEYISEPAGQGSTVEGNRTRTIEKVFMTAKYSTEGNQKFITYDVFFHNDGKALGGDFVGDAFWFYPPRDLLYNVGSNYPVGVVSDAYYERYQKKPGTTGRLSDNPDHFTQVGPRYMVSLSAGKVQDDGSQRLWGSAGGLFQFDGGPSGRNRSQVQQMLKQLQNNPELNSIIRLGNNPNGSLPGPSYSHLLTISKHQHFAYKYHVKMRLRDDVTDAQAQRAGAMAVSAKAGGGTTAYEAYVYAATGTRLVSKPDAQLNPIQGLTVTKTVGDTLGDPDDPANSGYVRHKESKPFPASMKWSWQNGVKPASTATTAGVFKYKVIARYQDGTSSEDKGSGSDGTVTLNVKPKTPVIDQNSVNEKAGKKGQKVVVNVQNGVPDNSTVTLYSGNKVIGTGTTSGQKATINVPGVLPSTEIKAKTTVKDTTVDSEFSAPVIPTPERDTQPPTVKMTNPTNNREFVLGSSENNSPEVEVFRGATLDIPLKMHDNNANGKINIKHISGLPRGVNLNHGNTLTTNSGSETKPATATISGRVATDAHLGTNVVTLKASDDATGNVDKGNQSTLKFKVKTYDLAFEDRGTPVNDNTRSDVLGLKQRSADPNHYLTTTDGTNKGDGYFGADMKFRYLNGNEISEHVSFDKIGKYDVKARAYFPNSKTSTKGLPTNPTTGLTGDTASVAGRGFLEKTIEFNVKPNTPTLAQEQFYGTAGSRPSVTVGNLPTSDQLQNGSNVTVELYQGTTKVASKTVTDRNSTTTLFAGDFTANLREGQPVHAVVKVSGGQNATAYSVTSDNSADRNVTGRSVFAQPANKIVQIKKGNLSEEEKTAIKNAIFEANKNGILRGKTVNDITITDAGVIRAVDKDNKVAELEVNPTTGVVTRYAHIRDDYNLTFKNNGILANRPTDKGFEWSQDGKSLIYKFDATKGTPLPINDILNTITANPKNPDASRQPSLTVVNGTDKVAGERKENGYKHEGGFFYHNNKPVNVLDIVRDNFAGGGTVDNSANKLVETNRSDVNDRNIVGTNLEKGTTTIPVSNGAGTVTINTPVVKAKDGSSLIVKRKLYLMPKWTDAALLAERNTTLENNTNVINLYFVPVDPIKPEVARSNSNNLATSSNQATRLAENTSFTSLVKVTDNYDKDDATNATTNTVRSKLNMWVKTGNTKTLIVENGVEKTDVITRLKKEVTPATYEVFAKTTDASGNKSHEDNSDGASLGFFKVGYNLVARQTINVVRGETLTQAELNKLVQVREGNTLQDLPQGATVTAVLETASIRSGKEETKTVEATVNFGENRTQKINLTYKVLNTFPIARTLYDFKNPDTARSGGSSVYYHNGGTIPDGMTWIYKASDNVAQPGDKFTEALAKDPVGTTNYKFGGKYDYSRNTNRPTTTGNLEYTETVTHKVFDVEANRIRVTVSKGATLTEQNAKDAVAKVAGSEDLPTGTTYEWVNAQGNKQTLIANTPGVQNYRVKVTLPMSQTGQNQPDATQKRPSKIIDVKVNVKPEAPTYDTTIKPKGSIGVPTVASTDRELTGTGRPGAKIKVTVPGVPINEVTVGNNGKWRVSLPKGLNSNQLNQTQLVPRDQVTVTQIVDGIESDATNVAVSLGETTIQPSEERGNSLFAGAKNIVVKAPHDAGMVYVSYTDKATGAAREIGLKRENINSTWVSNKPTLGEVKNTTKDAFTNTITIEMKESIAEGTAKAIANISERNYSSAVDWKTIQVTNQAPTVTSAVAGNEKVLEFGENIDLKTLVTKADYEDDKDATRGTKVRTEIVSVNGQNDVKDINSRKPGTYIVKYKAIDSQGKESGEIQLTVKVREDKPTPPTATAPSDGTVTVTPTGDADKVTVNYTDEKEQNKTVTVVKDKNGTWSSSDKPVGVTVDSSTGQLLIPAEGVKDKSQVTATATKGDSHPSEPTTVTAQAKDFTPVKPDEKVVVQDKSHLTPEEKKQVEDKVKAKNPGKTVTVGEDGTATVTDPSTKISHPIAGKDLVIEDFTPVKPDEKVVVQDKSHLTPEEKKQVEDKVKAKNPGKTVTVGDDGTATVTDLEIGISHDIVGEEMTLIAPPTVELPEFKGGVNGELPDPITLPELTIEVRWIDEDGNVLKPSVKTGNEKDVEHGSIPGYEFVRTVIDENEPVITHIFRKVSGSTNPNTIPVTPVTPDTNRGSGQDAPAPTTPVPDAVTPNADQVDTKTTVDNGAKSNGSQNVLPNTGTESNATLASLGLLGMLGGLGLALAKKKED